MEHEHKEKQLFGGKSKRLTLSRGLLRFAIQKDDKEILWEIDLIKLKMQIELLETSHGLNSNEDDRFIATNEFIGELRASLSSFGCPVDSESVARQVWVTVSEAFAKEEQDFKKRLAKFLR